MKEIIFENGSVVKAIESKECVRCRGEKEFLNNMVDKICYEYFRDATEEETDSVNKYIESISRTTNERFFKDDK